MFDRIEMFSEFSKYFHLVFVFVIVSSIERHEANSEPDQSPFSINLEQIKYDLFLNNDLGSFNSAASGTKLSENCLNNLKAVQNGLAHFEQWAMKSKFMH